MEHVDIPFHPFPDFWVFPELTVARPGIEGLALALAILTAVVKAWIGPFG